MKLTNLSIQSAKPKDKPYSMTDGAGLYLLIKKSGSYWRYNYRFMKKQKTLALGVYPDISLKDARRIHQKFHNQVADGVDPAHERKLYKSMKIQQSEDNFKAISLEWLANQKQCQIKGLTD